MLFGIDPGRIAALGPLNALLASLSSIPVPRVLRSGVCGGRRCIVVERMAGTQLGGFAALSDAALEELGRGLAGIHLRSFPYYGSLDGNVRYEPGTFPRRLAETMRRLVAAHYGDDRRISEASEAMQAAALHLPVPGAGSLVMVDMDPSQFLTDGTRLTALVDTDAYVVGPRELDFIGLEYVCDQRSAAAIARGYRSLLPLPALSGVRPLYRYLYRLMEVQDAIDLDRWMQQPAVFSTAG